MPFVCRQFYIKSRPCQDPLISLHQLRNILFDYDDDDHNWNEAGEDYDYKYNSVRDDDIFNDEED